MRNYIKLVNGYTRLTRDGGIFLTDRYFIAEDEENLVELQNQLVAIYSGSFNVDPPVTQSQTFFFRMNKSEIVRSLNSDSPNQNGLPAMLWNQRPESLGLSDWSDFLKKVFVDKSPRKREKHRHHG